MSCTKAAITEELNALELERITKRFECRPCSGTGAKVRRNDDGSKRAELCGCCDGEGFRIANEEQIEAASQIGSDDPFCRHNWSCTGTAYGGGDASYTGEGRLYCSLCGADGDA